MKNKYAVIHYIDAFEINVIEYVILDYARLEYDNLVEDGECVTLVKIIEKSSDEG